VSTVDDRLREECSQTVLDVVAKILIQTPLPGFEIQLHALKPP